MGIEDLYLIVSTLPDEDGVGIFSSIDQEKRVDLCYRVKSDGSIVGWVSLDHEEAHPLPITLCFTTSGDIETLNIRFQSGFMAQYTLTCDSYYFPSEEVESKELCITTVDC